MAHITLTARGNCQEHFPGGARRRGGGATKAKARTHSWRLRIRALGFRV